MDTHEDVAVGTRAWVEQRVGGGHRVDGVERLRGGWTSEMRRLRISGPGTPRWLVLRSFIKPFFVQAAEGLLTREADILRLLAETEVPVAVFKGVDATAAHCDHPSLLMSLLPGSVRLDEAEAELRAGLLARQLLAIHQVQVPAESRPRVYEAWTSPELVRLPESTPRPDVWQRAVDVLRREPPAYRPCFLHRDFHPGNVLFTGQGPGLEISGVVDWVETSWGPADLDVAHCSTALALLYGPQSGMRFAERYLASGGTLSEDPADHLYWRVLDALGFAPDAEKVAVPWRELGRDDLTPALLTSRLEDYLYALLCRFDD
ncbi:phosphotransferase family protein [Streptomyces sp. RTd22]|uniref:phosphotransferase family protein n=1 Tax=Streptomyces sp. RTd22 TaxID=1841249 RepID=UPI0007C47B2A|nr:phosphotransferase [Streptomyces sp. RTd22]